MADEQEKQLIITEVKKKQIHRVHLDEHIDKPEHYRELSDKLVKATPEEEFIFIINTSGGYADTTIQLRNLIMNCRAITTAQIFYAASAGSILTLSCDRVELMEHGSMMIHNPTQMKYGNYKNVKKNVEMYDELFTNMYHKVYKGFLSKNEIERALSGEEFWFWGDECFKRLERWNRVREKEVETLIKKSKKKDKKNK